MGVAFDGHNGPRTGVVESRWSSAPGAPGYLSAMRLILRLLPVPVLAMVAGCRAGAKGQTCDFSDVASGAGVYTLDDDDWSVEAARWSDVGSGVSFYTHASSGWTIALVAQTTTGYARVSDVLDAGSFPFDVLLGAAADGGWVDAYPYEGGHYRTEGAVGGELTIVDRDGDDLLGCFSFVAADPDTGGTITVEDGRIRASEL
jgi:hypothetical protein